MWTVGQQAVRCLEVTPQGLGPLHRKLMSGQRVPVSETSVTGTLPYTGIELQVHPLSTF